MTGLLLGLVLNAAHPVEVIDFGPQCVGGYTAFEVKAVETGTNAAAVLRVAYSVDSRLLGPKGDFCRETAARYLGDDVDLPILPANIDRFELYPIASPGPRRAALLQGLARYARLSLDTPGAAVEVTDFRLVNDRVHSEGERAGAFSCSDERLNRVWEASVRTCELSAIPAYAATNGARPVLTLPYLADGAKRDRLVWSGDLWWAADNVYCGFRPDEPYMKGSLAMLAANQTPEGYVQACPWPDRPPPKSGEYGPFPSDEFAAWFVPVLWNHHLHRSDGAFLGEMWPTVAKLMGYLDAHTGANGIFEQRRETSKHACDLAFGEASCHHRAYMNILLWTVRADAAKIAAELGKSDAAEKWSAAADRTAAAVRTNFWDAVGGRFVQSREDRRFGFEANALALATGFATDDEARRIMPQLVRTDHGKFQALAVRGKFRYGDAKGALEAIAAHNWFTLADPGWKGAALTSECASLGGPGWGDEAHPDTALAGVLTAGVLGVEPLEPGYCVFRVRPPVGCAVTGASGEVPTPHGVIRVSWTRRGDGGFDVKVDNPPGTRCETVVPSDTGRELAKGFLPAGADVSSWSSVYRRLDDLDGRADRAWLERADGRVAYDRYRKELRRRMVRAMGGFPEKTPLNARITGRVQKDGYAVEKVLFESMPGLYVTGNLFLPDRPDAKPPYATVVMSCGHAESEGKDCDTYQRACVLVAQRGMAAFMFDPYEQGERREYVGRGLNCCQAHNLIGLKAMLLGWSMPMLRVWDGIRAVDYVLSRPDVDPDRIGYMGQSGGGTLTALMTAVDDRLKATAPSCYLTSLGYLCRMLGPQDAEQNVFGQLAFGLNHTGYVLMSDAKVCVTGRFDDMFPWGGVAQLKRTVDAVAAKCGTAGCYDMNFAPGPHGWTESTETASADWMRAWLVGGEHVSLMPLKMERYRPLDIGFDPAKADCGLTGKEIGVTPEYSAARVAGARSIHDILRERLGASLLREPLTDVQAAALARKFAGVVDPSSEEARPVAEKTVETVETQGGLVLTRRAYVYEDGLALPAVRVERRGLAEDAPVVLMVGAKGRGEFAAEAERRAHGGERVVVADVTGAGEIGRGMHDFYGANADTPEEGTAVMLYLMGESMVGRRASDILMLADRLVRDHGGKVRLVARGSVAVAAAHAYAVRRDLFASVETADAPVSWTEFILRQGAPLPYRYTSCVNGALLHYDWPDLLD